MSVKLALLDPNPTSLNALAKILKDYECQVFTYPEAFLDQLKSNHFDVLISEWELPTMSGEQFCGEVSRLASALPILFLSGMRDPEVKLKAFRAGAFEFLTKPFNRDYLKAKLASIVKVTNSLKRNNRPDPDKAFRPIDEIIAHLKMNNHELEPRIDQSATHGYSYDLSFLSDGKKLSFSEQLDLLEKAVHSRKIKKRIFDLIQVCPKCFSMYINLRNECGQCRTPIILKGPGERCPNCYSEIVEAKTTYHCLKCGSVFNADESKIKAAYSYFLEKENSPHEENLLTERAREYGFRPVLDYSLEQFISRQMASEKFVGCSFSIVQVKFVAISGQIQPDRNHKSVDSVLLLLKKLFGSKVPVFITSPDSLAVLIVASSARAIESKKDRLFYYLREFELSESVKVRVVPQNRHDVFGFLETSGLPEDDLP